MRHEIKLDAAPSSQTNILPTMNGTDSSPDPGFVPAMVLIGLLFVLSVAGVVHSLLVTFAG